MIICLFPEGRRGRSDLTAVIESFGHRVNVVAGPGEMMPEGAELAVVQLAPRHAEALAQLRRWRETMPPSLPVLAIGRWTGGDAVREILNTGATDYLTHPYKTQELELRLLILRNSALRVNGELRLRIADTQRVETISALAGSLAHDFNNVLAAILGNAEVALLDPHLGDSARYSLTQIDRASRHAAELTRQMLALAGRPSPGFEPVHLDELVEEMADILRASISRLCRVEYHIEADLPPVTGAASQLRQVVLNLLLNASEAMAPGGGVIRVSLRQTRQRSEPRVVLEIADSGPGIPPEIQGRIFEPFYSTKRTGRGLGLAAVRAIVEAHGGEVSVSSQPGSGATFRLDFPAQDTPVPQPVAVLPMPPTGVCGAVLLVEDEPALREAAAHLLAKSGFQLVSAGSGDEAERIFRRRAAEFDAVILDLALPGASGEGLLELIRSKRPDLQVIVWSGYDEESIHALTVGHPIAATLRKPCHLRELAATLARVLTTPPCAVA
ncbi:MAG: response regulator [Bryobacteraceae bacterium]|nr:response regulator [Bryobacteraceae bacterium]